MSIAKFQKRRDLQANWQVNNPVLADGEEGYERDTGLMKVGNGVAAWNDLAYFASATPYTGGVVTSDVIHAAGTGDVYTDSVTGKQMRLTVANGIVVLTQIDGVDPGGGGGGGATDGIVALVSVDSADIGSGNGFPVYAGTFVTGTQSGDRSGTDVSLNATGSTMTLTWSSGVAVGGVGGTVTVYGSRGPSQGIVGVTLDGGVESLIDCYAATRVDGVALFTSQRLAIGAHTIRWRNTGTKNSASIGTTVNFDGLDLTNAFPRAASATVPGIPTNPVAVAGNAQATVTWTAPVTGGSPITLYTVTSSPGGIVATSSTTSKVVTGLTNNTAYTFTVKATNAVGQGLPSVASAAVTPTSGTPLVLVPVVVVDDQDVGTGDTYPTYTGVWQTGLNSGSRGGSDTYTDATGKVVVTWTGGNSSGGAGGINIQPAAGFEAGAVTPAVGDSSDSTALSTTHAFESTHALAITLSAATGWWTYGGTPAMQFALTAQAQYTASIYVWASAAGQAKISIETYNGSSFVGTLSGTYTTLTIGNWTRISATGTTAAGVNTGNIVVEYQGSTAGTAMWNDAIKVELGSTPTTWSATGAGGGAVTTQFLLYGSKASHHGIGKVKIDGGVETDVDQYAAVRVDNALLWTSPAQTQGQHTVEYRWSGTKNASSSGTTINFDGCDLTNAVARTVSTGTGGGGTGGTSTSGQPPITRVGTKLFRNGVQWKFAGLNADKWFGCWGGTEVPSDAQLATYFAGLNPHSVTRIWPYNRDTAMMDRIVSAAESHGQYLAPAFFDGNSTQCSTHAVNLSSPSGNVTDMQAFVSRYAKNADPATKRPTNAIAFWECGNEVGGSNAAAWYQAMANGFKAVDPNTLVGMGSSPSYDFGGRAGYEAAGAGQIDLLSVHEYDANTGISGWGDDAAVSAGNLNKPWYCGEDGFCCGGGDTGSKAGNATKLDAEWSAYIGNSTCAGMLYWSSVIDPAHGSDATNVFISSGDAMWQKAQTYRHAYHGV